MRRTYRRLWIGLGGLLGVVLVYAGATIAVTSRLAGGERPEVAQAPPTPSQKTAGEPARVTLTDAKLQAARLKIEPSRTLTLPVELVVPGRIEANADRRIDIRPRAPGVVRSVEVQIGQVVKAGVVLVTLDSPDIGTARLNLRNRLRELTIARSDAAWKATIAANVNELIPELKRNVPTSQIELRFAAKPLGNERAVLLSAYADWQIATHEEEKQKELNQEKIVGEHPVFVSIHTREGAQAKFEGALEQVRYDTGREKKLADQQVRLAEAATVDAAQRLRILGITVDLAETIAHPEAALGDVHASDTDDVTAYPITAPFDGTIIMRNAVVSQRAELADMLFTLADVRRVRVQANIPESDFGVLPTLRSGKVRVAATAYPGRLFDAQVLTVGAVVDPATRTVPLLAEMPNPDGLLKLGMFTRVVLDSPRTEHILAVPEAAVIEIEGRTGVFIPQADGHTFDFRPVTAGRSVDGRRAIVSGLKPGERVVGEGAFALKSELILQNQPEED
jgi:RND family efflux transporter MFP subunit